MLADPLLRALALAPEDDEPETEEERAAVAEARAEMRGGTVIPHAHIRRELSASSTIAYLKQSGTDGATSYCVDPPRVERAESVRWERASPNRDRG